MKKVMIGILILIPVVILLVVALVSNIISIQGHIAVDSLTIYEKGTKNECDSLTLDLESGENGVFDFSKFVDVSVMPKHANRYTIKWSIDGEIKDLDATHKAEFEKYAEYAAKVKEIRENDDLTPEEQQAEIDKLEYVATVLPAAMMIDDNGGMADENTTGKMFIGACCTFKLLVEADGAKSTPSIAVTVEGYDVKSVSVVDPKGNDSKTLTVGESKRVEAQFNPSTAKVNKTIWASDNEAVAKVDQNGVITAVGVGEANITVKANVYKNQTQFVESSAYKITVNAGVSKFGNKFITSLDNFTFEDIGVDKNSVRVDDCRGCTIVNNTITLTADNASIVTDKGTLSIEKCASGELVIVNADVFDIASGFVLEVGPLPLKLKAVYKDMLAKNEPTDVVWTSSRNSIATVEGGIVSPKNELSNMGGPVIIAAEANGYRAEIELNVQRKVVSMELRSSQSALAVGIAQETVFAAEKYVDVGIDNSKTANSTFVTIVGEPKREAEETLEAYRARLNIFYNAYNFEIVEGGEYAEIVRNGDEVTNEIRFKPAAIEGKGKVKITLKVSAKYPKFESVKPYTEEMLVLTAVYGVEVKNIKQLRQAAADQKDYAYADGNLRAVAEDTDPQFEHLNTEDGRHDIYRSYDSAYSEKLYAIVFADNIAYETNDDGTPIRIYEWSGNLKPGNGDIRCLDIYGDIFGNNYLFTAAKEQLESNTPMLWLSWSNITVSNLRLRSNELDESGTISATEASGLKQGECFKVISRENDYVFRLKNVRIEFCIAENGKRLLEPKNCDLTIDGVIMRNVKTIAIYSATKMDTREDPVSSAHEQVTFPMYNHITINNCVFSNCIATIASFAYERYTVMPKQGEENIDNYDVGDGRFVRKDKVRNAEYFKQHFMTKGINTVINQTGFLDIYNWQKTSDANIIDLGEGNEAYTDIIKTGAQILIEGHPSFEPFVYRNGNDCYFHMGFICAGISMGMGLIDEPVYLEFHNEDKRFINISSQDIDPNAAAGEAGSVAAILKAFSLEFFCYANTSDIVPAGVPLKEGQRSVYEVNLNLYKRLNPNAK